LAADGLPKEPFARPVTNTGADRNDLQSIAEKGDEKIKKSGNSHQDKPFTGPKPTAEAGQRRLPNPVSGASQSH